MFARSYRYCKCIAINQARVDGCTPFYFACCMNRLDIVKVLLAQPSIDTGKTTNDDGTTPFYCIGNLGHIDIMKVLYEYKVDTKEHTNVYCYST